MYEFMNMTLYNKEEFFILLFRFLLNGIFAYILIDRIYYRVNKNREYLFTLFIFNILIFFVTSMLSDVKLKTGVGFGLFAVFSILRYRTEQINIKEMTFLFTGIVLAVTNSLITVKVPLVNILFANIVIVTVVYILERIWLKSFSQKIDIIFDDITLINKNKHEELMVCIEERTGFKVHKYEIIGIDYLKDVATLTVYYK